DNWEDNYICDIRELVMPKGLFEVFKYCFKDVDIKNPMKKQRKEEKKLLPLLFSIS
ncbi:unnamed protein product, partial [marine sediment metagenome]